MRVTISRYLVWGSLAVIGFAPISTPVPAIAEESSQQVAVDTLVSGLLDPVGIAVDPRSGALFIAEPGANRISIVMSKTIVGAFRSDFKISNALPASDLKNKALKLRWSHPRLRAPIDLVFDKKGRLFVAESEPGARILAFDVREDGFASAVVVACSPPGQSRVYSSIGFDDQDRLCAISYDPKARDPAPKVELYAQTGPNKWESVEDGSPLPVRSASGKTSVKDIEWTSAACTGAFAASTPAQPVQLLEWLHAQPAFGRMVVDPSTGTVYATMRGLGTIVKLKSI